MPVTVLPPTFDYAALDPETRIVMQQRTGEIRTIARQAAGDIIEIGAKLSEVKACLGHGQFGAWLGAEFGWSQESAQRFMRVAERFQNRQIDGFAPSALYMLAAPAVPDEARQEALDRAAQGQRIGVNAARQLVQAHQPEFVPVWELEQGVRRWLAQRAATPEAQLALLTALRNRTTEGLIALEELLTRGNLAAPRRKADVHQALNNILEQLRQRTSLPVRAPTAELEAAIQAWLTGLDLTPAEQVELLQGIADFTPQGRTDLGELRTYGSLPPHEYQDLKDACYTLLTELRAAQIRGQVAAPEDSAPTDLPTASAAEVKASIERWLAATYAAADQAAILHALNANSTTGRAAFAELMDSGFLPTFYQETDLITALRGLAAESVAAAPTSQQAGNGCRVICADSRQLLHHVAPNSVHLVITSPPYNVGINYNGYHDDLPAADYLALLRTVFANCRQVLVPGGRFAVVVPFGTSRSPWQPRAAQVIGLLTELGFGLRGQITWDKGTTGNRTTWGSFRLPTNPALRDRTEAILVAHTADGRLAVPENTLQRDAKGAYSPFLPSELFLALTQDLWAIAPESAQRIGHPAPFPIALAERLIRLYGYPGCHVVDPFAGSGTVGVAARKLGCQATLVDIDADYCRLAQARIQAG